MRNHHLSLLLVLGVLGVLAGPCRASETAAFDVYLDERPVGEHVFEIDPGPEGVTIQSRARFDVKVLGITFFKYRHQAKEVWQGGCLANLESETRTNGDRQFVKAERQGEALSVETPSGASSVDSCVRSFAYWDPSRLNAASRLLNPQTGEWLSVEFAPAPPGVLDTEAKAADGTQRYRLTTPKETIELTYGNDQRWLGLRTELENGHTLRYERRSDS